MGEMLPYLPSLDGVSMNAASGWSLQLQRDPPDHELVVTRVGDVIDIRCSEQVVRDISVDVAGAGAPFDRCRDTVDAADQLLRECELINIMVSFQFNDTQFLRKAVLTCELL